MSIKLTIIYAEKNNLSLHLYRSMIDDLYYLEISDSKTDYVFSLTMIPAKYIKNLSFLIKAEFNKDNMKDDK